MKKASKGNNKFFNDYVQSVAELFINELEKTMLLGRNHGRQLNCLRALFPDSPTEASICSISWLRKCPMGFQIPAGSHSSRLKSLEEVSKKVSTAPNAFSGKNCW